ncbi:MAG: hypothetical protein P8Y97_03480 [Candidatus Lokiarchaeota archaeon]
MEREIILKYIKIFCGYLIILTGLMEIINFIIISFTQIQVYNKVFLLIYVIFNLKISKITLSALWIIQVLFSSFQVIFGFLIVRFSVKNKLSDLELAKYILIFGFFILIFMIVKMELFYMISNSKIVINTNTLILQKIFYSQGYIPFYGLLMWIFYLMAACYLSVLGMILSGSALAWILKIEKREKEKEERNSHEEVLN